MSDRDPLTEQQRAERRALLDDYFVTFTSESGRRVLADMRTSAFCERTSVHTVEGRIDPYRTHYNEGARNVLLALERKIQEAKQGRPEPFQTHAVSSTAERSE